MFFAIVRHSEAYTWTACCPWYILCAFSFTNTGRTSDWLNMGWCQEHTHTLTASCRIHTGWSLWRLQTRCLFPCQCLHLDAVQIHSDQSTGCESPNWSVENHYVFMIFCVSISVYLSIYLHVCVCVCVRFLLLVQAICDFAHKEHGCLSLHTWVSGVLERCLDHFSGFLIHCQQHTNTWHTAKTLKYMFILVKWVSE